LATDARVAVGVHCADLADSATLDVGLDEERARAVCEEDDEDDKDDEDRCAWDCVGPSGYVGGQVSS
jgi:hypothetical protein